MDKIELLEKRIRDLENTLYSMVASDRLVFSKDTELQDGRNIQLAKGTGTKIGTETTQKLGFWNATPVVQPSAVADVAVSGTDTDGTCRTKVNDLLTELRKSGIIAT